MRGKSKLVLGCATAAAGLAGFGAQAIAEPIDRGALEELFDEPVTLSATGAPQRANEAPVNMTIITQEDIRRSGAIDLPGVLERLANVDVMRDNRGMVDVTIRGYNSTLSPRLLVLLNGRQVYLDHYGMTNWSAIPVQLSEIRQIEVVSGPNTALFGFNAVAGVVNIITYDALRDDVDEFSATLGEPGYARASGVWTAHPSKRMGVRVSAGSAEAESYSGDDAVSRAAFGHDAVKPVTKAGALNISYDLATNVRADFEATWSMNEQMSRFYAYPLENQYETNSFKLGVSADTSLGMLSAQIYSNNLDQSSTGGVYDSRITVGSVSLIAKPAPAHIMRFAGEIRRNDLEQGQSDLIYFIYSLSGMWNWQASQALALTSAARFDLLELRRSGPLIAPTFPFQNADYDGEITQWSYNLGAVYRMGDYDSLRMSAARGVGAPSLLELGLEGQLAAAPPFDLFYAGDPSISPTIVYNIEAGWDHELPALGAKLRAAVFWQKNEDLKVLTARATTLSQTAFALISDNVGESEMHGIELGLTGQAGRLHWDAQYAWRHIDDALNIPPQEFGLDYEHTSPEHVVTAGLAWVAAHWEIGADARYTSATRQYGIAPLTFPLTPLTPAHVDAYTQLNARLAWRPRQDLRIELSGRDLLESRTQTVGLSPTERSAYLTLAKAF
jgi:outer membrane receptor protein involved in Fe transport